MLDLIKLAGEGDAHANEAIKKQARMIGRGMRAIMAAVAPEVILVTGDITAAWSRVAPVIEQELASLVLAGPASRLIAVEESEVARLRGAAALVLQRHTGRDRPRSARIRN
jgi:predicted NBD/HSP70 family sugar kinase